MKKLVISLSILVNFFALYGIEIIPAQKSTEPALIEVAKNGDLQKVEALIAEGADINQRDSSGNTPLIKAISFGHFDVAKDLIDKGADINAFYIDKQGKKISALTSALYKYDIRFTKLLLQAGADTSLLGLGDKLALKLGLWFDAGPYHILQHIIWFFPIFLKFLFIFLCFLILMWPGSIIAFLKVVFLSILSTILFAPLSLFLFLVAGFSGSFLFGILCFLLLGLLGYTIDVVLIYLFSKKLPLKVESYPVWVLVANLLTIFVYILMLYVLR